jgi:hypothetical protein
MSGTESHFSRGTPHHVFVEASSRLTGASYTHDRMGLMAALPDIRTQHLLAVFPNSYPDLVLTPFAGLSDDEIRQKASIEIGRRNFGLALSGGNILHGRIERLRKESEEDAQELFDQSLGVHREIAAAMDERIRMYHLDILPSWTMRQLYIGLAESSAEYVLLRDAIHYVVKDGKFGDATREQFDPLAIIEIQNVYKDLQQEKNQ